MTTEYDVIVLGLGVMGAACAAELAARGARVLGLDRFHPPHERGSSHGGTRITREAYFENPLYVPLVRRARSRWHELERGTRTRLVLETGGLTLGPPDGALVRGTIASAREHDIPIELLSADNVRRRLPTLRPEADMVGVLEPGAALLFPELCVAALHESATRDGASLRYDEQASWRSERDVVTVTTPLGRYAAPRLVLAAGAWLPAVIGEAVAPLQVTRQTSIWVAAPPDLAADRMPLTLWETAEGAILYTCPDVGAGFKAAIHHAGATTDPDSDDRTARPSEVAAVAQLLSRHVSVVDAVPLRTAVCLYTSTPDHDFIIDRHPSDPRVTIASACSGHGFKFAPVIGEIVADLVTQGTTSQRIAPFALERFRRPRVSAAQSP